MRKQTPRVYIRIPYQTVMTVLVAIAFAKIMMLAAPMILPLVLSILLAVAATPMVQSLRRLGLHRHVAVLITTMSLAVGIALILYLIVPTVYDEISTFIENFPQARSRLISALGQNNPIREFVDKSLRQDSFKFDPKNFARLLGMGNYVLGGVTETLVIFVFAVYLIADGPRMIEWISAFFSGETRLKIHRTCQETSKIIAAYVLGQLVTSLLSFTFVFITLSILKVPNVLLLATLSGLLDVLPVLGFIIAVVPAMLFALDVNPSAPFIVLAAYLVYHLIENYIIVPFVYGKRLRVSSFIVFFGLLVAWSVAGIEGAIAILPIVASYPVVERIWLTHIVRNEAIKNHQRESREDEPLEESLDELFDAARATPVEDARGDGERRRDGDFV